MVRNKFKQLKYCYINKYEYGSKLDGVILDDNYIKYVGFSENNILYKQYFNKETVNKISKKVTELLMGVDPDNRPIIVPDKTIISVMNNIQESYVPPVGDIHSRYIVPSGINSDNYIENMINQTIEVITSDVRNN